MRALVLALLAAGCAAEAANPGGRPMPPERVERALDAWVAHGNREGECRAQADLVRVHEAASPEETQELCRATVPVYGCLTGNTVVYDGTQDADQIEITIEHELRHWMGGCAYGVVDGSHEHWAFWYPDERGRDVR